VVLLSISKTWPTRVTKPALAARGLKWFGWHGYRRGLATNLKQLGIDDLVIQAILRHSDVSTTRRSYIKAVPETVTDCNAAIRIQD
jgi:integrase